MSKTQKILLIIFCTLLALLLVTLFVAAGVSVAKNGMQGLVGELFGDTMTQAPETMPEEQTTQSEADIMDMLFDLAKAHRPSYRDMFELYKLQEGGADLLISDAVEMMGKPHDYGSAGGRRFFVWELDNGQTCTIYTGIADEEYKDQPTPWDAMLKEGYGGAYVGWISYSGSTEIWDDTLFDVDIHHKPSYEDCLQVEEGMTVTEIVEILGKPHGAEAATGSKYIYWCLSNGYYLIVHVVVVKGEETYTDWDEIMTENYGGAICSDCYVSSSGK